MPFVFFLSNLCGKIFLFEPGYMNAIKLHWRRTLVLYISDELFKPRIRAKKSRQNWPGVGDV